MMSNELLNWKIQVSWQCDFFEMGYIQLFISQSEFLARYLGFGKKFFFTSLNHNCNRKLPFIPLLFYTFNSWRFRIQNTISKHPMGWSITLPPCLRGKVIGGGSGTRGNSKRSTIKLFFHRPRNISI